MKKKKNMFLLIAGKNSRSYIFSFLNLIDLKKLFFLDKVLFHEILSYLKTNLKSLKSWNIINLESNQINNMLHYFQHLNEIEMETQNLQLQKIILNFPNTLKFLKLNSLLYEDFASSLKFINEKNFLLHEFILKLNIDSKTEILKGTKELKIFFANQKLLKTFKLKIKKNEANKTTNLILANVLKFISKTNSNVLNLELENLDFNESSFFLCKNIKNLKIRHFSNNSNNKEGYLKINFSTFRLIENCFPNLTSLSITDDDYTNNGENYSFLFQNVPNFVNRIENLETLILNKYGFPIDFEQMNIMRLLTIPKNITSFGLSSNKSFNNNIIQEISSKNFNLIYLNFDYSNVDDFGAEILANSETIKSLETLSIKFCRKITSSGLSVIFTNCERLKNLDVRGIKGLRNKTLRVLTENSNLEEFEKIYLHENKLKNETIENFMFKFKNSLKVLEISKMDYIGKFSSNFLGNGSKIFKMLKLKKLDVSFNISAVTNEMILRIINLAPNLTSLNVKSCEKLTDFFFIAIENSIWRESLIKLNCKYCLFSDFSLTIPRMLTKTLKLTYLNMDETQEKILIKSLQYFKVIKDVSLNSKYIFLNGYKLKIN